MDQSLKLGVIGNCSVAALVTEQASIEWFCYPQFDADPVLCRLINGPVSAGHPGYFELHLGGFQTSRQRYIEHTAILSTVQQDEDGHEIEIIDFCPVMRWDAGGYDLPKLIIRMVRKVKGSPVLHAALKPMMEHGAAVPEIIITGDHEAVYKAGGTELFLQTNAQIDALVNEMPIAVDEPVFFVFGEKAGLTDLAAVEDSLAKTEAFWKGWVGSLRLPELYREETIRAAIGLKLCTHRPTGGMVAAMTSSIPEYDQCKYRHWDYRYSWVRDNYFTLKALVTLGDRECLHVYAGWLKKILTFCREQQKWPAAFRIAGTHDAEEWICNTLSGYDGQGMVRIGNEAYEQQQNDFFAGAILSLKPFFTDQRFSAEDCPVPVEWLEQLAQLAFERYAVADTGLWEFRTQADVYTYSAVNCWAAADAMAQIYKALGDEGKVAEWTGKAADMHKVISEKAWNTDVDSFTNSFMSSHADASVFLIAELGFLAKDDPRLEKTISFLESRLRRGVFVFRHDHVDDFGTCVISFVCCTFWMLMAFIDNGKRVEEARKIFDEFLNLRSPQGYLSEHIDQNTGELWANYPQTYSLAGIVSVALKLDAALKR